MLCPVCKHECGKESICVNCGFDQFRVEFVSREDAEDWLQNIVIPYRTEFNSRVSISSVDWIGKLYQNKEVQYFLDITVPAALKQNTTIGHHVNFLLVNRYGKEITLSHIPNFEVGKVNRVHGFFEIF